MDFYVVPQCISKWYFDVYSNKCVINQIKKTILYIQINVLSIKFKKNENVTVCRGLEMKVLRVYVFN